MRVVHLPKRTETSLITESDQSGPNHQLLQLCTAHTAWSESDQAVRAVHSCISWFRIKIVSLQTLRPELKSVVIGSCTLSVNQGTTNGWMTCDFKSFSTVFQPYQDDWRVIWKAKNKGDPFSMGKVSASWNQTRDRYISRSARNPLSYRDSIKKRSSKLKVYHDMKFKPDSVA